MSTMLHLSEDQSAAVAAGSSPLAPAMLHHAVFMPRVGEPVHAYAARLRAMHHHLTMLIEAVERGMSQRPPAPSVAQEHHHPRLGAPPRVVTARAPAFAPAPHPAADAEADDRRADRFDRRFAGHERRQGHPDRRRGLIDLRAVKVERRVGPRDRRSGRRDRRLGHDRRADARHASPALAGSVVDPVAVFWGINIACWLGITAVAMIWGVG